MEGFEVLERNTTTLGEILEGGQVRLPEAEIGQNGHPFVMVSYLIAKGSQDVLDRAVLVQQGRHGLSLSSKQTPGNYRR